MSKEKKERKIKNISRRKFFTIDLITIFFFFFINNSTIFLLQESFTTSANVPAGNQWTKRTRNLAGEAHSNQILSITRHVTHENILTIFRLIYSTSLYTFYTYIIHIFYIVLWQVFGAIFTVSSNFPPTIELRTRTPWIFFLLSPACRTNFRFESRFLREPWLTCKLVYGTLDELEE